MFMITQTEFTCNQDTIRDLCKELQNADFPVIINEPTGEFFSSSWKVKQEFAGTVYEKILSSLKVPVGQARIIKLDPGSCYHAHADIDDRYHLNLQGEECYLVDLETKRMYPIENDGYWYEMNAGLRHSAINFGRYYRYQIVVRKPIQFANLSEFVKIELISKESNLDDARFNFDKYISPWLNRAIKNKQLQTFKHNKTSVFLEMSPAALKDFEEIISDKMEIIYYD